MENRKTKIFNCFACLLLLVAISIFCVGMNVLTRFSATASQNRPENLGDLQSAGDRQLDDWAEHLESFDGRDFDIVTPARNQGTRDICWAYAAVGAAESNILRKGIDQNATKSNLDFDERVLAYARFNRDGLHDPLGLTIGDAGLAYMWDSGDAGYNAFDTMTEGYALVDQVTNLAETDMDAMNRELVQSKYYVQNYFGISQDINEIKRAILKYGAVAFSYVAPTNWQTKYYSGSSNANHESLIVGWDDNIEKTGFSPRTPKNNGAWIVKNSWGKYGNDNNGVSCFYMSYEEPFSRPYVVDIAMRENYQNMYHYDGQLSSSKTSNSAEKQAAIYEAKLTTSLRQEQLIAATINTDLSDIDVKVEVYKNLNTNPGDVNDEMNNPEQGPCVASKTVHIGPSGYYTIDFDAPINLNQGEYFSIVISSDEADGKPVATSINDSKKSVNDMTYFYADNKWQSYKKSDNYADTSNLSSVARIRAITNVVNRGKDFGNDLENARVEIDNRLVFYEAGQDLKPKIEVYFDEERLEYGVDYELEVLDNESVGMAKIIVAGKGKYKGKRETYFEVAKGEYAPGRISGTIKVYDDIKNAHDIKIPEGWEWIGEDKVLEIGRSQYEYNLIYRGADADLYQYLYSGFYIEKIEGAAPATRDISETNMEVLGNYVYTGEPIEPRVNVTYLGKKLEIGKDYELDYQNNTNAGNAAVIVRGKGNYEGQQNLTFQIQKAGCPSSKPKSTIIADQNVTNLTQIKLGSGWSWQKNLDLTSDKIQAIAVYNGTDKSNFGSTKMLITVTRGSDLDRRDISLTEMSLEGESFVYDGVKKEPNISVTDGETDLSKGTDFEVEYQENVNAGRARAIIRGKGEYTGTRTLYFTIDRADIQDLEVSQPGWTFGESAPAPTIKGQIGTAIVTVTYSDEQDGTYTENVPTNAGNYWIKAVVESSQNYNFAEAKAAFTIEKAEQPKSMPDTEMTIGREIETLQSVLLIDGWTWEDPNTKIIGESMTAWAEYADKENYKNYRVQITLTKEKEPPKDVSGLSVDLDVKNFVYNGTERTPNVIAKDGELTLTLGVDYDVRYEDNKFAGQGKAIVTFKNDYVGTTQIEFTISKAEKPNVDTTIRYNQKASKLSDIPLPDGFVWEDADAEITGNSFTAKAVYTGEDASSYETTELTFEITIEEQEPEKKPEQDPGSQDPKHGYVLGLAIGIPVAALAIAGIVGFVIVKRKRNK